MLCRPPLVALKHRQCVRQCVRSVHIFLVRGAQITGGEWVGLKKSGHCSYFRVCTYFLIVP